MCWDIPADGTPVRLSTLRMKELYWLPRANLPTLAARNSYVSLDDLKLFVETLSLETQHSILLGLGEFFQTTTKLDKWYPFI